LFLFNLHQVLLLLTSPFCQYFLSALENRTTNAAREQFIFAFRL